MKAYRFSLILVVSVALTLLAGILFPRLIPQNKVKDTRCYVILKSNYISDRGIEHFSGMIIFSFSEDQGSITTRAELTTTDNKKINLFQQVNFKYAFSANEYTLHVTNMIDDSAKEKIPKETTNYMSNVLNIYFANPKKMVFWIYPALGHDYVFYNEAIPWLYCNKLDQ